MEGHEQANEINIAMHHIDQLSFLGDFTGTTEA
jgi:hypothetical protein